MLDPRPPWQEAGIHGLPRAREWDVTVAADAPELRGDAASFVALPDGTLLVEDGRGERLEILAEAVERELSPPYRARGARQLRDRWLVQARRIRVLELPDAPAAETLELTPDGLLADGLPASGRVPQLEGLGDVVRAERLDGDLWEIRAERL
ncbi:MAG TPA: hypothetical protein VFL60_09375 [Gaiellaceae bacterium]|nr:hypothetical protein [Gaiellaceae bacterium]